MKYHSTRNPSGGGLSASKSNASEIQRIIAHLDMDSFFASVEQSSDPRLRGMPVFICGEGRTVVVTASYEARAYGIKTGMTKREAFGRCPAAVAVAGNHQKYIETSKIIFGILKRRTDKAEMFSIDEAFLDLSGVCQTFDAAVSVIKDIKSDIRAELGLSSSAGISVNKLLAKVASEMKKPDGLTVIRKEDIDGLLERLSVEKFCGVGAKTNKRLAVLGIRTAKQLGEADEGMLAGHFGFLGHILKKIGLGLDDSEVAVCSESGCEENIGARISGGLLRSADLTYGGESGKSFGHSYTMPKDTTDERAVSGCLMRLSEKAARRMRTAGYEGRVVHFSMRYADFTSVSKQRALKLHISSGYDVYRRALGIMRSFGPFKKPVRMLGVSISGLRLSGKQLFLFEEDSKRLLCQQAVDYINDIYGENTLRKGS